MSLYVPRHARARPHRILAACAIAGGALAVITAALVPSVAQAPHTAPVTPQPAVSTSAPVHASPPPPTAQRPAQPRTAPVLRYAVRAGDCLWTISVRHYGSGTGWRLIYAANRAAIGLDPGLIRPGQLLVIPPPG